MYAVTGATGQLGHLVIQNLLKSVPAAQVVALVRDPSKAADLAHQGVQVRAADYNQPETLLGALAGVKKLLLISGNEVGHRVAQHKAVIDAARTQGVGLVAYTSLLHADRSKLGLAEEHRQTEQALKASGLPHVLLRNGWYTENRASGAKTAVEHGALIGAAGAGRVSSAARADYAEAAAAVLTREGQAGRIYELAGDTGWTLAEFAAEIARQAGKSIDYKNLSQADYQAALAAVGLPTELAKMLADSDARTADGELFDDGRQLSQLIGRATTPIATTIASALKS